MKEINKWIYRTLAIIVTLEISVTEAQWRTVWRDDFNGGAGTLPKNENWVFDVGTSYPGGPQNWGTGEIQTYTRNTENVRIDGRGNLMIVPLRDGSGRWTSARIESRREDFRAPNGGVLAIEGRIQMPNVQGDSALGYWPAFWAIGSPLRRNYWSWPAIGEFDIMENVNGINRVWGVLHCGVSPGGPCRESDGLGGNRQCPGGSCQSSFHVYRFEWDDKQKELRWYVDGQEYHKVTRGQVGTDTWNQLTDHGYFLLLNVAIGGGFPNGVAGRSTPTSSTVPGVPMVVDYIAVYTRQ